MPRGPRGEKRPADVFGAAVMVAKIATGKVEEKTRNPVTNMPARAVSRMSHPYINEPKYWRERAEEARSIAKLLNDQEAKRQLFAIAARYYRLADHIKQRPNSQNSK